GAVVLPQYLLRDTGRQIPGQFGGWMGARHDPWLVHAASPCTGFGPCPQCFHYEDESFRHTASPVFDPPNLRLRGGLTANRMRSRLFLLDGLEESRREPARPAAWEEPFDRHRQQAFSLLTSPKTRQAFDLHTEKARVLDAYGRNRFGWSLLLTRRLLEAGVNMIQVNLGRNGTWDLHSNAFPIMKEHLLPQTDRALATFLDELAARGLLEETLVVM